MKWGDVSTWPQGIFDTCQRPRGTRAWPRSGDGMDQAVVCKNVATQWLGLRFEVSQDEVPCNLALTLTYRLHWRQARSCSRRRTGCWPSPRLARRYQVASKSDLWHQELRVAVQALASPAGARETLHINVYKVRDESESKGESRKARSETCSGRSHVS